MAKSNGGDSCRFMYKAKLNQKCFSCFSDDDICMFRVQAVNLYD